MRCRIAIPLPATLTHAGAALRGNRNVRARTSRDMNECPMYRAGANTDICQKCGQNRFAHRMTEKRYFNDQEALAFFENADKLIDSGIGEKS